MISMWKLWFHLFDSTTEWAVWFLVNSGSSYILNNSWSIYVVWTINKKWSLKNRWIIMRFTHSWETQFQVHVSKDSEIHVATQFNGWCIHYAQLHSKVRHVICLRISILFLLWISELWENLFIETRLTVKKMNKCWLLMRMTAAHNCFCDVN